MVKASIRLVAYALALVAAFAPIAEAALAADTVEIEFWQSVKDSSSAEEIRAYLDRYPNGAFSQLAHIRLKKLVGSKSSDGGVTHQKETGNRSAHTPAKQLRKLGDLLEYTHQTENPKQSYSQLVLQLSERLLDRFPSRSTANFVEDTKKTLCVLEEKKQTYGCLALISDVLAKLANIYPDQKVQIYEFAVTALERRSQAIEPEQEANAVVPDLPGDFGVIGAHLKWLEAEDAAKQGLSARSGALIEKFSVVSAAKQAGLRKGDFILSINGRSFATLVDLINFIRPYDIGTELKIQIERGSKRVSKDVQVGRILGSPLFAARKGNTKAMINVAQVYASGTLGTRDFIEAKKWLDKAALAGDARAHALIAQNYQLGSWSTKVDFHKSLSYAAKASEMGDALGSFIAGKLHHTGKITGRQSFAQAKKFYALAVKAGHPRATANLGLLLDTTGPKTAANYRAVLAHFRRAHDMGVAEATHNLGELYSRGAPGIIQDCEKAKAYFLDAISRTNLKHSHHMLAELYISGCGVAKNRDLALEHYRKAAEQDFQKSIDRLKQLGATLYSPLEAQQLLKELGYDPGPVDGRPGKRTIDAVKTFQRSVGLVANGRLSLFLIGKLRDQKTKLAKVQKAQSGPEVWTPKKAGEKAKKDFLSVTPNSDGSADDFEQLQELDKLN